MDTQVLFLGGPLHGKARTDPRSQEYVHQEPSTGGEKFRGGWTPRRKGERTVYVRHAELAAYVAEGYEPTGEDKVLARR